MNIQVVLLNFIIHKTLANVYLDMKPKLFLKVNASAGSDLIKDMGNFFII